MIHRTKTAAALLLLAALAVFALPVSAAQPLWPLNNLVYGCTYQWPDGSGGTSTIYFTGLWANPHIFPDGNQLKRGTLVTLLPGQPAIQDGATLAWKPNELPDPPGGTNFELTLQNGIQCKRFRNYGHLLFTFDTCNNGIVQTCQFLY
jgi:hypothetical protein